ncbi:kinase-like domain-containing protein [Chiua virens]|nr:kinase-like domain-containing protein [Chiua virens]
MECYLCHKLVNRHEYTRHVASHPPGDFMGMYSVYSESTSPLRTTTPHDHVVPASNEGRTRHTVTPSSSLTSTKASVVPVRVRQQEPPSRRPASPNSFRIWLENQTRTFSKYTVIDGQASTPDDSQAHAFKEAAQVLRGTTREEIAKIVNAFEGFPSSGLKENCLELIRKVPIFPGLVAYTYTHLITCPYRGWFSSVDWSSQVWKLRKLVDRWIKWGDTWCFLSCETIKEDLLEILRATRMKVEEHICNSALLNETMVLNHDILHLAALAALCVTGPRKADILEQRAASVDKLIELFHSLLESNVELEEGYRRCFLNVIILLSKESGCCPRSICLSEDTVSDLSLKSEGGFGLVYQGRVGSRLVAVKAIKRDKLMSLPEYNKQLCREAIVWKHLRHPNCLPLYGVCAMPTEGPNISFALVSPWMAQGTISKYLKLNPQANKTRLILDVVRGLNYLHTLQPHIAHRDIKPDNILVTGEGRACLADFGLVSAFDTDEHFHTAASEVVMGGTFNYMAPEIFNAQNKEERSKVNKRLCDMYALGCTIYEVYTGKPPFDGLQPALIADYVVSNQRPAFPEDKISHDMWTFVENLWDSDPSKRLTAQMALSWMEFQAVGALTWVLRRLKKNGSGRDHLIIKRFGLYKQRSQIFRDCMRAGMCGREVKFV